MIAHVLNWLEAAGIANILVAAQQNGASKIVNYVTKIYENQMVGTQIEVITTSAYDTADVLRQIKDKIHVMLSSDGLKQPLTWFFLLDGFYCGFMRLADGCAVIVHDSSVSFASPCCSGHDGGIAKSRNAHQGRLYVLVLFACVAITYCLSGYPTVCGIGCEKRIHCLSQGRPRHL